jgi:glycosyltransferase involved in cell wall biosynthesis
VRSGSSLPSLTYYRPPDPTRSFRLVAQHHIAWLRRLGVSVDERDLAFRRGSGERDDGLDATAPVAIVHPLFLSDAWGGQTFEEVVELLGRRHITVLGMEVADTSRISGRFVAGANHPGVAGVMLPSRSAIAAYRDSGVVNALGLVPHGVDTVRPSRRFAEWSRDAEPRVLVFATNYDVRRKGWDLLARVMAALDDVRFVVKACTEAVDAFAAPNVTMVTEWLGDADLASLYRSCDVALSLHRAGSFELNCAEAAAYGVPLVTPRAGGVADYLDERDAHFVRVLGTEPVFFDHNEHCGLGVVPDVDDAVRVLRGVLDDLPAARRSARRAARAIRRRLSWRASTQAMIDFASARSSARS